MLTLFTPATGFPDLEAKIAYGLARIGIEAGYKSFIKPQKGFYKIDYENGPVKSLSKTFSMIAERLLSSDRFFDLGVKAKDKGKYSAKHEAINEISKVDLTDLFAPEKIKSELKNIEKDTFCGHEDLPKFGGRTGLILLSSFHAGKPYERDRRFSTFNQSLCSICGYLAVLGLYSFCFIIGMGKGKNRKDVVVLPIPEIELKNEDILRLFSLQKTLHNFWLSDLQPLRTFTISLLAKVPSICDVINEMRLNFHLTMVSKDNRGDTVVEQIAIVNALPFSRFISSSAYNSATIEKLLGDFRIPPKISALMELNSIIEHNEEGDIPKFARLYVQETSTDKFINLLYPETVKYLLKEVAMISTDIIENPALESLARTLRYFIREKKYGYADDIRNARKEARDFEETIAKMLREGELRRVQQEQDKKQGKKIENWIYLPKDTEIKEVFSLANKDFESTKTALVILAFSFPSRAEETIEEEQNAE